MSGKAAEGGQNRHQDPATALTTAEAATMAGVDVSEIESSMADGALLFETQRLKGREVPMIRLMDLADLYPALGPEAEAAPAEEPLSLPKLFSVEPEPEPGEEEVIVDQLVDQEAGTVAEAVRASSADRGALIDLCQDLETRLDLAERERQASTASLLMAQRRVLDLEQQGGRRPMAVAAAATLGLFGLTLAILAFRLPNTVSAAARDEVRQAESRFAAQSAQLGATIEASLAAARTQERARSYADRIQYESQIAALETRLGESRKLQLAELEKVAALAVEAAAAERSAAAVQRAVDSEQRRDELALWETRIQDAELVAAAAREALEQERVASGADRAAFRAELGEALARHNQTLDAALTRIEKSAEPPSVLPFGPIQTNDTPAPWWKRAFQAL